MDNTNFTPLTLNARRVHFDAAYAENRIADLSSC
jgi:hypothetical protein